MLKLSRTALDLVLEHPLGVLEAIVGQEELEALRLEQALRLLTSGAFALETASPFFL